MNASPPASRRYRLAPRLIGLVIVAAVGGAVVWGFLEGSAERAMEAELERPVEAPIRVSITGGEPTVTLTAAELERSGIELVSLQETEYPKLIRAYGTLLDLEPLVAMSNNYTSMRAELQTARARLDASRTAFDRAKRLYEDEQNMSLAQFQAAEAAFRTDDASVASAETQLQNLASSAAQQWGELGGALVERAPVLLRLLERQDVLLQVTLPPGEFLTDPPITATVRTGSGISPAGIGSAANAAVTNNATGVRGGGDIQPTIEYLSRAPRTDPRIQGVSFFYTASADSQLLPGMNVDVLLSTGETLRGALVPPSALVWTQGRSWAYFASGEGAFARRELPTDSPTPDGGYFFAGLPNGTQIVGQGAQLLLSEEFRAQIQVGEE